MTDSSSFTEHRARPRPPYGHVSLAICLSLSGFRHPDGLCRRVARSPLLVAKGRHWGERQRPVVGQSTALPWRNGRGGRHVDLACRDLRAADRCLNSRAVLFVAGCGRVASCFIYPGSPALLVFFAALELAVAIIRVSLRRLLLAPERRRAAV